MDKAFNLPKPVGEIMEKFTAGILGLTTINVEGIYLNGSIPLGDFYSNKSDIDFLVLCDEMPNQATFNTINALHKNIANQYPRPKLSGSYITQATINHAQPETQEVLTYHEGKLEHGLFEMAPISLFELKQHGWTVFGVKAEIIPIRMTATDVNQFMHKNINTYWANWINSYLQRLFVFLFPRMTEWAVLGVARQFFTLCTGRIASKSKAGVFCLEHLPKEFHTIIQEALNIRDDNRTYPFLKSYALNPSFKRYKATLACVNYIIGQFNERYRMELQRGNEG